jgi:rhodanese-related sulfurtransferase
MHARMERGDKLTLIDVRTPEEFGRFCIPGADNIPGGNLILWAETLRDSTVIVNCAGRTRSIVGTATLRRLGLRNVHALRNGTMGWLLAGFALEQKPGRAPALPADASRDRAAALADLVAREENIPTVSIPELLKLRAAAQEVFYLIDVRSEAEYQAGHIPGSLNVSGGQAVQRADDFVAVRNARVVFLSDRGSRATMAAYWYRRMGFPRVAALRGGLSAWEQEGQELHAGAFKPRPFGYENLKRFLRFVAPQDLMQWLNRKETFVLDVSTSVEFEAAHVPGARWISRGWLDLKMPFLFPDRRSRLALACADGQNALLAARTLEDLGYSEVFVLDGGMQAWIAAGLPTSGGLENCLVEANDVVLSPSIRGDPEAMKRYLEWEVNLTKGKGSKIEDRG